MTPYEARQQAQRLAGAYRTAAGRLWPDAHVSTQTTPIVRPDGAFVNVTVFVPRDLLQEDELCASGR